MQRDFLTAPSQPTESDDKLLAHLNQVSDYNANTIRMLERQNPRKRLSVVLDTPGVWNYPGGYNAVQSGMPQEAPIIVHFESNHKKVPARKVIVCWSLFQEVYLGINEFPFTTQAGGFSAGLTLFSNPYSAGASIIPAYTIEDVDVESLVFLYGYTGTTSNFNYPTWIQPQIQNVGNAFSAGNPGGGIVSLYAWGE